MDASERTKAAADREARLAQDKAIYQLTGGRVVSVSGLAGELYQAYVDRIGTEESWSSICAWADLDSASKAAWEAVALAAARTLSQ